MCGRFAFSSSVERVAKRFGATLSVSIDSPPRFNIAPTQPILGMLNDEARHVVLLRWGLVPHWAANPAAIKRTTFNARIETIATAPAYRGPLRSRRCAIFADSYYEWRKNANGGKTPMLIRRRDGEPFCFAGLWDIWGRGDQQMQSCAIVTQPPNELLRPIHSRMPVVLHDADVATWLRPGECDAGEMLTILNTQSSEPWEAYPVSPRVGNVRNDDAALLARV